MARAITLRCDLCGDEIPKVVSKLYLAPVAPGKTVTSFQSLYSHHGDLCSKCTVNMSGKLKKRQARASNGKVMLDSRRKLGTKKTA